MNTITIPKKELKLVIQESIREVINQESMKIRALFLPSISLKEQKGIEKNYVKPSRKIAKSIEIEL